METNRQDGRESTAQVDEQTQEGAHPRWELYELAACGIIPYLVLRLWDKTPWFAPAPRHIAGFTATTRI